MPSIMTILWWVTGVLAALTGVPAALCFVIFLIRGDLAWRILGVRFFRWAVLTLLIMFNIAVFRYLIATVIHIV